MGQIYDYIIHSGVNQKAMHVITRQVVIGVLLKCRHDRGCPAFHTCRECDAVEEPHQQILESEVSKSDTPPARPGSRIFYGSIHHDILSFPCEVRFVTLGHGNPCGSLPHLSPSPSLRHHRRQPTFCVWAYKTYVRDRRSVALALAFASSHDGMTAAVTM